MKTDALYDRDSFFKNYMQLRADPENYNDLYEQPAVLSLLPAVTGLRVLDLGCGYGPTSVKLMEMGAKSVFGVDVSKNMIELARKTNNAPGVEYQVLAAQDIGQCGKTFDLVFSSLMLHYIEDLAKLFEDINGVLEDGGELVFSMEHPIVTATKDLSISHFDANGRPDYYYLSDYALDGERKVIWLDAPVLKYHRRVSTILNMLVDAGFEVLRTLEPCPDAALLDSVPRMREEINRPSYFMCKCRKKHPLPTHAG